MSTSFAVVPEGYKEVREGKVYRSDLVWNSETGEWEHPKTAPYRPFADAKGYWCVARKIS